MRQLEIVFDAIPGVTHLAPYLDRARPSKRRSPDAPATIASFPLGRCSTVDVVELGLRDLRGKRRHQFWAESIAKLRRHLERCGLSETAIERELWAFHAAVERRLNGGDGDRRGGDAA